MIILSDNYKHVPEGMANSARNIEKLIDDYNQKLQEMQNEIDMIDSSPAWQDAALKSAFNKTCNGYMQIHNNRALKFSFNNNKLKERAKSAEEFENAYTKG